MIICNSNNISFVYLGSNIKKNFIIMNNFAVMP